MGNFHFCKLCIRIHLPLVLSDRLILGFCTLSLHLDCSLLCLCPLWHLVGPPAEGLFQALQHLLAPGCQASPHQPSHIGSMQTTMSTANVSCYCHCNDYSSDRDLYCHNGLCWAVPHVYLMQWLCLSHGPTAGVTQQEITGLSSFYLPHSVVSGTLHSIWSMSLIN